MKWCRSIWAGCIFHRGKCDAELYSRLQLDSQIAELNN